MSKTLYLSDLDGTLLRSNMRMSEYSLNTINRLIDSGVMFSYATARSMYTAMPAVNGLLPKIPLIVYNGAFIVDSQTGKSVRENLFLEDDAQRIYSALSAADISPIVYSVTDGRERYSYYQDKINDITMDFVSKRNDERKKVLRGGDDILSGDKFYFTCIDEKDKLTAVYNKMKTEFNCVFQADIYSGDYMLEIMPKAATKAHGAAQLKELCGCDKIVCFGDAANDIPMFKIADECYAVENADDELKELATGVIGGNDDDGVAKWLERFAEKTL